jgi:hemoglobin
VTVRTLSRVSDQKVTLYEAAGGMAFFEALVDRFYEGVASDPVLLRIYPEPNDLAPARHRLTLFLAQYWGGPSDYNDERGHPRLRMRHAPFAIGIEERDRWLMHMRAAVASLDPPEEIARALGDYFELAAESMRNQMV